MTAESGVTTISDAYKGRVKFDINTQSLELQNLTLGDSGKYGLSVITNAGGIFTGETSLQVFGECFAKTWFSIYYKNNIL